MKFIYTNHAKENLEERKIKKEVIENAILYCDNIIEGGKGRKIAHKIIGQKLLRVIYKEYKKAYIVITAYYTKPERYSK